MKLFTLLFLFVYSAFLQAQTPSAESLLDKIDLNMSAKSRILTSKMVIHGRRTDRSVELKTWSARGSDSFTEYLAPAREKGTKMLKLKNKLWVYTPSTDRIIQISGHMLRQSVMGSDLSYEDLMDDEGLKKNYHAKVIGTDTTDQRNCWLLELTALTRQTAYYKRKMWVDKKRFIPLKEELFAKSGTLLKRLTLTDVARIEGRWYPTRMVFKDMLKKGKGTEFIIDKINFNAAIPKVRFSKASLRR